MLIAFRGSSGSTYSLKFGRNISTVARYLKMTEFVVTYQWPVTIDGMKISVADTRVLDVDENLIRTWLLNWNLLVLDWSAGLLNHLRPLLGRNGTHVAVSKLFKMLCVDVIDTTV